MCLERSTLLSFAFRNYNDAEDETGEYLKKTSSEDNDGEEETPPAKSSSSSSFFFDARAAMIRATSPSVSTNLLCVISKEQKKKGISSSFSSSSSSSFFSSSSSFPFFCAFLIPYTEDGRKNLGLFFEEEVPRGRPIFTHKSSRSFSPFVFVESIRVRERTTRWKEEPFR